MITRQGWAGQNIPTTMPSRIIICLGAGLVEREIIVTKLRRNQDQIKYILPIGTTNLLTSHSLPKKTRFPLHREGGGIIANHSSLAPLDLDRLSEPMRAMDTPLEFPVSRSQKPLYSLNKQACFYRGCSCGTILPEAAYLESLVGGAHRIVGRGPV